MTMPTPTRRNIVRGAAWTVPVVAIAATAPAFAASQSCRPFAECKKPGASQDNTKTYVVVTNCGASSGNVVSITVDGQPTTPLGDGRFETIEFKDSRNYREVVVTFNDGRPAETYTVPFPPCGKGA
jgi:hypothetical protein